MFKKIAVIIVILIGALLVYAATKPGDFRIQRTTAIKAPADKIFPLINDYHNWPSWSPYEKLDPNMKKILSGAASGKGSVYEWDGNSKAGKGRMEITDSVPSSKVTIKLDFSKPMEGHNVAEFTLVPSGDSTSVTWAMSGPMPYVAKVMSVFFDMDKLIGKEFETGLANMKAVAEK
jgi:hypothetical protein